MHLLGRLMISLIFYDLYGGLLSELCNDPGASLYQCTRDAKEGTPLKYYDPPSYIFQSDAYSVVCDIRIMTKFLECRSNITNSCPDWRDDVPGMSNEESFKAFIIGTCLNRHVLQEGLACLRSYYKWGTKTHFEINTSCLTYELVMHVNAVYANTSILSWQQYCRRMTLGIECSINKTKEFGCSEEFYDFLLHSTYMYLPEECHEHNSSKFKWIDMYTEIPTKLPENWKRKEEPNTVSSATCNDISHIIMIALNLIFSCYKKLRVILVI